MLLPKDYCLQPSMILPHCQLALPPYSQALTQIPASSSLESLEHSAHTYILVWDLSHSWSLISLHLLNPCPCRKITLCDVIQHLWPCLREGTSNLLATDLQSRQASCFHPPSGCPSKVSCSPVLWPWLAKCMASGLPLANSNSLHCPSREQVTQPILWGACTPWALRNCFSVKFPNQSPLN